MWRSILYYYDSAPLECSILTSRRWYKNIKWKNRNHRESDIIRQKRSLLTSLGHDSSPQNPGQVQWKLSLWIRLMSYECLCAWRHYDRLSSHVAVELEHCIHNKACRIFKKVNNPQTVLSPTLRSFAVAARKELKLLNTLVCGFTMSDDLTDRVNSFIWTEARQTNYTLRRQHNMHV